MGAVKADESAPPAGTCPHLLGAHVPTSGGLIRKAGARRTAKVTAAEYAETVKAGSLQLFVSNPRGWARSEGDPVASARFHEWTSERGIPVIVHASMLVNLGSPDAAIVEKSAATLRHAVARGRELGARGVVFHAGSSITPENRDRAFAQLGEVLTPLLDELGGDDPDLLVEPTAGGGAALAAHLSQLEEYFAAVGGHPRLGVCLDTCHAMAAGHDLSLEGGMGEALEAVERFAGKGRLRCVHVNDSRDPCGSRRDRHEAIGAGSVGAKLGAEAFAVLFTHPIAHGVPLVVETPMGDEGAGHAADIALLRTVCCGA
jgi:deoxyribonuclease-4